MRSPVIATLVVLVFAAFVGFAAIGAACAGREAAPDAGVGVRDAGADAEDAGVDDAGTDPDDAGVDPLASAIDVVLPFTTTLSVAAGEHRCFRFTLAEGALFVGSSPPDAQQPDDGCRPPLQLALYDDDATNINTDTPIEVDDDTFCRHQLDRDLAAGGHVVCASASASAAEPLNDIVVLLRALATCGAGECSEPDRGGIVVCERGATNRMVDTAGCAPPTPPPPRPTASGCTSHDECAAGSYCVAVDVDSAQNACVAACASDDDCGADELCLCEDETVANEFATGVRDIPRCVPFTCRTDADCDGAPCGLGRSQQCDVGAGTLACRTQDDGCGVSCGACVVGDPWLLPEGECT